MVKTVLAVFLFIVAIGGGLWYFNKVESDTNASIQASAKQQADTIISSFYSNGQHAAATPPSMPPAATSSAQTVPTAPAQPQTITHATLHTNKGDIEIVFNPDTPNTVANFIKLAQGGFYDGTKFHRVIPGFMIQGGDPLSRDDSKMAQWGTGGPGYTFADEFTASNHNAEGTIAMANSGPNTNGSQFFINAVDNSYLDTKHVVFGRVVSGMDVVHAIEHVKTGENDRPLEPVIVTSVVVSK